MANSTLVRDEKESILRRHEDHLAALNEVQMLTTDGKADGSLTCAGSSEKDMILNYVVPEGFIRHQFSSKTEHSGRGSNANVYWLTDDPYDGRVKLEVNSNFGGNARAVCESATATRVIFDR